MDLDPETHRQLGIDLFNLVWSYLDKTQRTIEENDAMLHAAHASRYHWSQVGTPVNLARGEWQVSRVYSVLRRSEPALYHAQRCLDICLKNQITGFDLAYAYEALARGYAVAQQWGDVHSNRELAFASGNLITEKDDKEWFFKDIETIPASP